MKTVLVLLDGSTRAELALPFARHVAEASQAKLVLVGGNENGPGPYLQEQAGTLLRMSSSELIVETSTDGVVDIAETTADPVIVMTKRTRKGLGEALSDSVDETVVRRARCPIILIGPSCALTDAVVDNTHVLLCTDGSLHSEAVVPAATALAKALRLRSVVFQVSPSGLLVARVGRPRDVASAERVARRMRDAGLDVDYATTRDPDPAAAIIEFAMEPPASVIAIATHGRTGLARVVLGSVAADVVSNARCPVLLVRPHLD